MKNIKRLLLLILFAVLLTACSSDEETAGTNEDMLTIYTSVYPIQFIIEELGEGNIDVHTVYPPGVDAHTYEPTSQDMTAIAESDAFFYFGAGMEGFAETAAKALENQDVTLVELGIHEELFAHDDHNHEEHVHEDVEEHEGHNHGDKDPHIWIDPLRMIDLAGIIKEELAELDPAHVEQYEANLESLVTELEELHAAFDTTLTAKENKEILVSHAGFGYWEDRYGIEQISINGLSSSSEPSQRELTEIIDEANKYNLDYIIFEQNASSRVSEIIQNEIGATPLTIHNLAVLTEENIENDEDYFTLMKRNLEVLDTVTD